MFSKLVQILLVRSISTLNTVNGPSHLFFFHYIANLSSIFDDKIDL